MLLDKWKGAAPEDWRAAKELLTKRWPERWSDHAARVAVLGPDDNGLAALGFQMNIHVTEVQEPACELHHSHGINGITPTRPRAVPIPTLSAEDAKVIETAAPSTKA